MTLEENDCTLWTWFEGTRAGLESILAGNKRGIGCVCRELETRLPDLAARDKGSLTWQLPSCLLSWYHGQ